MNYKELLNYCNTEIQERNVRAVMARQGNVAAAARDLGIRHQSLFDSINAIKNRAALGGYAPDHGLNRPLPDVMRLKGISDMRTNEEGKPIWYKADVDRERLAEIMEYALAAMAEQIPREKPRLMYPGNIEQELCNLFVVTDYHLGMLAWEEETGADWDLDIAEEMLVRWFTRALQQAPRAAVGILGQLGDFLHFDSLEAMTPTSNHILDADTRFPKLVRAAIRVIRRVIGMMLDHYPQVHVIMAEGNHDLASSVWLRELLAAMYEDEPRLTVDCRPDPYYAYEWGQTALFFHHGHKRTVTDVQAAFIAKFKEMFGRSRNVYAHMGHYHHKKVVSMTAEETSLMIVEQHRTLAANDAYASRRGWVSGRDAQVITYHKLFGEVGRATVNSAMVDLPKTTQN